MVVLHQLKQRAGMLRFDQAQDGLQLGQNIFEMIKSRSRCRSECPLAKANVAIKQSMSCGRCGPRWRRFRKFSRPRSPVLDRPVSNTSNLRSSRETRVNAFSSPILESLCRESDQSVRSVPTKFAIKVVGLFYSLTAADSRSTPWYQ